MQTTKPRATTPLTPPLPGQLAEQIAAELGLDFSADRQDRLQTSLQLAQRAGSKLPPLGQTPLNPAQLAELLPYLVVGETYFQRDPETLHALKETYLRPLLAQRQQAGQQRLSLWSAACCTGEEAYTLLFCLEELLGDALPAWHVDLLATDLNPAYIAQAKTGCYGDYAFRQSDPGWRARYFAATEQGWRLLPRWQGRVRFAVHNLAGSDYRVANTTGEGFDLILCRNVLMYLTPAVINRVLQHLQSLLAPEGRLLLSAAEAGLANAAGLKGELLGQGYAVGRRDLAQPPRQPALQPVLQPISQPIHQPDPPAPQANRHVKATSSQPTPPPVSPSPSTAPLNQAYLDCLTQCQQLANQGQLAALEACCQQALKLDPFGITPYWLLALAYDAAGQTDAALQALHKLVYLDPGFALAPYLECQLRLRQGQTKLANRAREHCLQLLSGLNDDAWLPHGDGLSVAQLRQLCLALEAPQA